MKKFILWIAMLLCSTHAMAALKVGPQYAVQATPEMFINVVACESGGLTRVWGDDHLSYGVLQWQKVTFTELEHRAHMPWLKWKNPLHQMILFKWAVEHGWAHYWTCYRKLYVFNERRKIDRKTVVARIEKYLVKVFPPTTQQGEYAMSQNQAPIGITLRRGDLLDSMQAIEALGKTYVPMGKDNYWFAKSMGKIKTKFKQEQRHAQSKANELIKQYGKQQDNGRFGIDPNDVENMQKYQDDMEKVLDESITISIHRIAVSKLEEAKVALTLNDQVALDWLLEEA